MEKISNASDLKEQIEKLERAGFRKREALKEEFGGVMDNLKPVNLIKHTLHSTFSGDKGDLLKGALSLGTGFLSKRLFVGGSSSLFKRIIGSALQFGVSGLLAKNAENIKGKGSELITRFLQKGKKKTPAPPPAVKSIG